jgi:hypothetical protein
MPALNQSQGLPVRTAIIAVLTVLFRQSLRPALPVRVAWRNLLSRTYARTLRYFGRWMASGFYPSMIGVDRSTL